MTLGAMWVRQVGAHGAELVVVSDSRVTGGITADQTPKIALVSRGDCVLSFAGETFAAYSMMTHIASSIDAWEQSQNRRYTLEQLSAYLSRMLTGVLAGVDYGRETDHGDSALVMLGGYSWASGRWRIYQFHWDPEQGQVLRTQGPDGGENQRGLIRWVGTRDAQKTARERFSRLRSAAGVEPNAALNFEPLAVVRDIIREGSHASVGGPLQIAKVYKYLNNRLFTVPWVDRSGKTRLTLNGRFLLGEEVSVRWTPIDPDTPDVFDKESTTDSVER
jgi:hypothetical protein